MIREATAADLDGIVPMARRFFDSTGMMGRIEFDPESTRTTIERQIAAPDGLVLVAERAGALIGVATALAFKYWFAHHVTAQEFIWWVEPEHRRGRDGVELHKRIEKWARAKGCETVKMIALHGDNAERLTRYYARQGYRLEEHTFCKELI